MYVIHLVLSIICSPHICTGYSRIMLSGTSPSLFENVFMQHVSERRPVLFDPWLSNHEAITCHANHSTINYV